MVRFIFNITMLMGLVGCSSMRYGAEDQWDRMPTATDGFFQSEEGSLELIFDHIPLFEKPLAEKIAKDKRTYKDLMVYSIGDKTYEIPVQVEIRGQTSRNDCPFPKLRVSFKKLSVKETPFSGHSGLRINTHCSDKGGYTEIGRVASERGPVRESMAYDLQESAGLPTFQHRLMKVSYKSKKSAAPHKIAFGLILEKKKKFAKRFGAKRLEQDDFKDDEHYKRLSLKSDRKQTLKALLFNSLIANFDYQFRSSDLKGEEHFFRSMPFGFHNMIYLEKEEEALLVPTDFDVAGVVTQESAIVGDKILSSKLGCKDFYCVSQFTLIQKWRSFYTLKEFQEVVDDYKSLWLSIKGAVANNKSLTEDEKTFTKGILSSFYEQLKSRNTVPVIVGGDSKIYRTEKLETACGEEDEDVSVDMFAPPGTPAFVLETKARAKKVLIVDTRDNSLINPLSFDSCVDTTPAYNNWIPVETKIDSRWPEK